MPLIIYYISLTGPLTKIDNIPRKYVGNTYVRNYDMKRTQVQYYDTKDHSIQIVSIITCFPGSFLSMMVRKVDIAK